jgi:hypothetical protein
LIYAPPIFANDSMKCGCNMGLYPLGALRVLAGSLVSRQNLRLRSCYCCCCCHTRANYCVQWSLAPRPPDSLLSNPNSRDPCATCEPFAARTQTAIASLPAVAPSVTYVIAARPQHCSTLLTLFVYVRAPHTAPPSPPRPCSGTKREFFVELKDMDDVDELQIEHKPAAIAWESDW